MLESVDDPEREWREFGAGRVYRNADRSVSCTVTAEIIPDDGGDAMRRVLLVSGLAILGLLTPVHANDDRAVFAAYCVGYYKYTVQEMQRSLNESRQWAQRDADQDRAGWQKVIDTSQRELQGEMLGLDRSRNDLAESLSTETSNNMTLAILMAERQAQDDLRSCFNEVAPGQDVPPSCKRVRRCREAENVRF